MIVVVWVATENEACEGGWVLGVAATADGAKALCQQEAPEPLGLWNPSSDGGQTTFTTGGRYFEVQPYALEDS